jgi:hypothetical protein
MYRKRSVVQPAPMSTLDGLAFDKTRGLIRGQEPLFDGQSNVGKQLAVFVTETSGVNATKGGILGMDDAVLHRDDNGILLLHLMFSKFEHLVSRCDNDIEDQAGV